MNKTKDYTINYEKKTITITKSFQRKASDVFSEAYRIMKKLTSDYPAFEVKCKEISKKNGKKSYKGLSIAEMERFLRANNPNSLEKFEHVLDVASGKSGKYAIVKKWFLDNFKDAYDIELETISVNNEVA